MTAQVTRVTNRCIYTLNRMYHPNAPMPPPLRHAGGAKPSMHSHSHPHRHQQLGHEHHSSSTTALPSASSASPSPRKQVNLPYSSPSPREARPRRLPSTTFSAPATRQQQRLLLSLRQRCATFVLTARTSSAHNTEEPCVGATQEYDINTLLDAYSFTHTGSPDHSSTPPPFPCTGIEGPLPASTSATAAAASPLPCATHSTASSVVVPLLAERIALPERLHIVPLTSVLPPEQSLLYSTAAHGAALLRPPTEILSLDLTAPLKPARVAGSRAEYVRLIRRLLSVGMIRFTATPKAVNGVFAVGKDADADRLIIDAQSANRLFCDSPPVSLPNPSHLVQLRVDTAQWIVIAKSDLSNFYHHLGLPEWMVDYFALPPLTPAELASLGLPSHCGALWPACLTLPMGFSHAVHLAQSSHEHVVYSSGALSRDDSLQCMRTPEVTAHTVTHGIVVDDLFLFCLDLRLAQRVFDRILDAYRKAGFVVKESKVVRPTTQPVKVIGCVFDRDTSGHSTVTLSTTACVDLAHSTLRLLSRGLATGLQLSHLIGRWTWCMLLRRPSLAVLQHCYRYMEVAGRRRFTLWPSVRRELWMLLGLLPLLHARLDRPLFQNVVATDASQSAAGVVCTRLTQQLSTRIWQMCSTHKHTHVQTLLEATAAERQAQHDSCRISKQDDMDTECATVLALSNDVLAQHREYSCFYSSVKSARWSTIISSAWRVAEHINVLELRAVLLALHWLLSYPSSHSSRVYLLVDSTVALYSLWKGRSSSAPLLLILRKISALLLASGVSLMTGWLPSAVNPADAPSRAPSCYLAAK